jgi:hypothetical protein
VEIISPTQTQVAIDFEEAHAISVGLFGFMEANELTVGAGVAGLLLTVQRLLRPDDSISDQEELKFLQASLDWTAAYFAEGGVN